MPSSDCTYSTRCKVEAGVGKDSGGPFRSSRSSTGFRRSNTRWCLRGVFIYRAAVAAPWRADRQIQEDTPPHVWRALRLAELLSYPVSSYFSASPSVALCWLLLVRQGGEHGTCGSLLGLS